MHSTTKYFGGHSDVLGGALIAREEDEFFQRVREAQTVGGAVPAPFDCWLVHRGMQTLPWRMRAHCENARQVADFLEAHPRVARVHYPGLTSHPQHDTRDATDELVWRDAFVRTERRSRRRDGAAKPDENLHPRHQPRRRGKSDRTPAIDRRPRHASRPRRSSASRSASSTPTT